MMSLSRSLAFLLNEKAHDSGRTWNIFSCSCSSHNLEKQNNGTKKQNRQQEHGVRVKVSAHVAEANVIDASKQDVHSDMYLTHLLSNE